MIDTLLTKLIQAYGYLFMGNNVNSFWAILMLYKKKVVGDCNRRRPEGSLFNSYYTEV